MGVEKLTDLEICLHCGEEMTYWYVIQGSVIFECFNCDDLDWEDDPEDYEEPCLCRQDEINPFCPSCY
jgi:hypothetical protein